ncbi:MAG: hypothetical protein GX286_02425 [Clostridiales bacterium]|jgi:hypothetical protein|nr:hypothetical protein [Clostridiales bacterium]
MKLGEKVSYLQGMVDGLDIDGSTKEGKTLIQMVSVLQEMVLYIDDLQTQIDELTELTDILDADLGDVEEVLFDCCDDDDECDCCCCDDDDYEDFNEDELYEVTCPTCEDVILLDEEMLEEGSMDCPNCGESLEFDFDEIELNDINSDEDKE